MDTVTIDGVEYVKALTLAKKLKYTSDYIGQLCRARKVDAHLVGRTWYVYPPSLDSHKLTRYSDLRSDEKSINNSLIKPISRLEVNSPLSKNVAKIHKQKPFFENRVVAKVSAYEQDDAELLPDLIKEAEGKHFDMRIDLAGGEKVKVSSTADNIHLESQPLPAIALSGTLKVQSLESKMVFDNELPADTQSTEPKSDIFKENIVNEREIEPVVRDLHPKKVVGTSLKVKIHRFNSVTDVLSMPSHPSRLENKQMVGRPRTNAGAFAPIQTPTDSSSLRILNHNHGHSLPPVQESSLFFRLVIVPVSVVLILVTALALVSIESVLTVSEGGTHAQSWRLNATALSSFFGTNF